MSASSLAIACPLIAAPHKQRLILDRLTGGSATAERLSALGLIPGAELEILNRQKAGSVVVALKESRLVLGPTMAQHLWVR
jgi:Fe2+ transport system protein FeoA